MRKIATIGREARCDVECVVEKPKDLGLLFCVKKRRRFAWLLMPVTNAFFRAARNPVEAIVSRSQWAEWEVASFNLLHAPEFTAKPDAEGLPLMARLPGESLSSYLAANTLDVGHLRAAGFEMRRAHALHCEYFKGAWSHGDPHTGNFVHDVRSDRARLIDFEMRHQPSLCADERHADDLLILLQDLCGRCREADWLPFSIALLEGYARPAIVLLLQQRLRVPGGFARLWWGVRTTWMARRKLEERLHALRAVLY